MKPNETTGKQEIMNRLKTSGELYVLLSMCTGEPYVVCDQETYDDEIIVRVLRDIYERYFFILQEFYTNFKARADE